MIRHEDTKFKKLFVGGIPYGTNDEALREFFLKFGAIKEAVVIRDRITQESKGYGFVSMTAFSFARVASNEAISRMRFTDYKMISFPGYVS